MSKKVKCSQCNNLSIMEDTFMLEGKAYCMDCLYQLIMAIAESGHTDVYMEDCEEKGLRIEF